jgi:hypothetical protein
VEFHVHLNESQNEKNTKSSLDLSCGERNMCSVKQPTSGTRCEAMNGSGGPRIQSRLAPKTKRH